MAQLKGEITHATLNDVTFPLCTLIWVSVTKYTEGAV